MNDTVPAVASTRPKTVASGHGTGAAMKSSLTASLRNWLPFTLYGLAALVLMVVAAVPLMLGYLILIPVLLGSVYASYRDIYR